jgi:hypothetical protein
VLRGDLLPGSGAAQNPQKYCAPGPAGRLQEHRELVLPQFLSHLHHYHRRLTAGSPADLAPDLPGLAKGLWRQDREHHLAPLRGHDPAFRVSGKPLDHRTAAGNARRRIIPKLPIHRAVGRQLDDEPHVISHR